MSEERYQLDHEKTCLWHMRTLKKKAWISLQIYAAWFCYLDNTFIIFLYAYSKRLWEDSSAGLPVLSRLQNTYFLWVDTAHMSWSMAKPELIALYRSDEIQFHVRNHSWPLYKKVKGQHRVIIWTSLAVLECPMLHTKFEWYQPFGFKEEDF